MKAPKYITSHANFNADDFAYLTAKGYSAKEIKARWDEEAGQGKGACSWGSFGAQLKLKNTVR